MASVNKVIIVGNLGRDPKSKADREETVDTSRQLRYAPGLGDLTLPGLQDEQCCCMGAVDC